MEFPQRFGKYTLLKRIATGGMAEIFLASQRGMGGFEKEVVVKRLLPTHAENEELVEMFLDEARIAAVLTHPNIAQIYDLGHADDAYFIAMEYVRGVDLRRLCSQGIAAGNYLPLNHAIRITAEVCDALEYAHSRADNEGNPLNIVHRDVSPTNILITYDGGVKLVDFGIAKAANKATVTRSGQIKGKFGYMAPEQARGDAVDHRTDLYAVGINLYEITLGRRLFKFETEVETLGAIDRSEIAPPTSVEPKYPPLLERVVMHALAREPVDRYSSARDFQIALEEFLAGAGLRATAGMLAGYVRSLFREQIGQEAEEGQRLKAMAKAVPDTEPEGDAWDRVVPTRPKFREAVTSISGPPNNMDLRTLSGMGSRSQAPRSAPPEAVSMAESEPEGDGDLGTMVSDASGLEDDAAELGPNDSFESEDGPTQVLNGGLLASTLSGRSAAEADETEAVSRAPSLGPPPGTPTWSVPPAASPLGSALAGGRSSVSSMPPGERSWSKPPAPVGPVTRSPGLATSRPPAGRSSVASSGPAPIRGSVPPLSAAPAPRPSWSRPPSPSSPPDAESSPPAAASPAASVSIAKAPPAAPALSIAKADAPRAPEPAAAPSVSIAKAEPAPPPEVDPWAEIAARMSAPPAPVPAPAVPAPPAAPRSAPSAAPPASAALPAASSSAQAPGAAPAFAPAPTPSQDPRFAAFGTPAAPAAPVAPPPRRSWAPPTEVEDVDIKIRKPRSYAGLFLLVLLGGAGYGLYFIMQRDVGKQPSIENSFELGPRKLGEALKQDLPQVPVAPVRKTMLQITSDPPGGRVVLNGNVLPELTPTAAQGNEGDWTSVRVLLPGYLPQDKRLQLQGDEAKAEFTLEKGVPALGSLSIESAPSGAEVFLNGQEVGQTPVTLAKVAARTELTIKLVKAGYHPHGVLYVVEEGGSSEIGIRLVPDSGERQVGTVNVESIPLGADVTRLDLDPAGPPKPVGKTGRYALKVNATMGTHVHLQAKAKDHLSLDSTIDLKLPFYTVYMRLPAPERFYGTLTVLGAKGYTVYVGNQEVGTTPIQKHALPEGEHALIVVDPKTNARQEITIDVQRNQTVQRSVVRDKAGFNLN